MDATITTMELAKRLGEFLMEVGMTYNEMRKMGHEGRDLTIERDVRQTKMKRQSQLLAKTIRGAFPSNSRPTTISVVGIQALLKDRA